MILEHAIKMAFYTFISEFNPPLNNPVHELKVFVSFAIFSGDETYPWGVVDWSHFSVSKRFIAVESS